MNITVVKFNINKLIKYNIVFYYLLPKFKII